VIKEQEGGIFDVEERRALTKEMGAGIRRPEGQHRRHYKASPTGPLQGHRAFCVYFKLVNIAEQIHR
jgi:hypothetical protein